MTPTTEAADLAAKMLAAMTHPEGNETPHGRRLRKAREDDAAKELQALFCREHGWELSKSWGGAEQHFTGTIAKHERAIWGNGAMYSTWMKRPLFDHNFLLRRRGSAGKLEYAIATHPYHVDADYKRRARKMAEQRGLEVEYPNFPSWWYPSETTLVLWTKRPAPKRVKRNPDAEDLAVIQAGKLVELSHEHDRWEFG